MASKIYSAVFITFLLVAIFVSSSNALISVGHSSNETTKDSTADGDPQSSTHLEEDQTSIDNSDASAEATIPLADKIEDSTDDDLEDVIPVLTKPDGVTVPSNTTLTLNVPHSQTYDKLYEQGVKHYLENEWHQCAAYIQLAIDDYHWYTKTLIGCRRGCKDVAESSELLTSPLDNTQTFFEVTIRNALCLLKCRRDKFSVRKNHIASTDVERDFAIKKPYDYLQLCLFKIGRFQEAASAAVTVLASQPDHTIMSANLKQYIDDFSADPELLENLELEDYAKEYVFGDRAHIAEDYESSVKHMEKALELYWTSLEDCRVMCEEPFDQGWFPDFMSSVANHYTFTFRCKRRCPTKLSNLYGQEIENFLPSIFNYLQFGYQKLDRIPEACGAVESFLEMDPLDDSMIKNKQFYLSEYQKMNKFFISRKEIVAHAARERYEDSLIHFIDTEFVFLEDDRVTKEASETPTTSAPSIAETLSDMLSTVFAAQPSLADPQKGEL